jgi:hypothetical protein
MRLLVAADRTISDMSDEDLAVALIHEARCHANVEGRFTVGTELRSPVRREGAGDWSGGGRPSANDLGSTSEPHEARAPANGKEQK